MKIIFLDIDGPVANTMVEMAYGSMFTLNPVTVRVLNNVCEASGAKIVFTSRRTWANNNTNRMENFDRFRKDGLDIAHVHPDWSCRYGRDRKINIETYLNIHPEITHYVIVDDEPVDMPNLVLVDPYSGITCADLDRISEILKFKTHDVLLEAWKKADKQVNQLSLEFDIVIERKNDDILGRNQNLIGHVIKFQ